MARILDVGSMETRPANFTRRTAGAFSSSTLPIT
jgi:hypothetical protein